MLQYKVPKTKNSSENNDLVYIKISNCIPSIGKSRFIYLAGDSDEEVDHSVSVLLLYRFGEQRLSAWHRLTAAKHLMRDIQNMCSNMAL